MIKRLTIVAAAILLFAGHVAHAAPTNYSFDTVTAIKLHKSKPSITGILRNTTDPITVSFVDNTNSDFRYVVSRCVPMFLTALEKPGKYFLDVTIDPAEHNVQLVSCELELRN